MRQFAILLAAAAVSALPVSARAVDANPYDGTWTGFYECGQGSTSLSLTLDGDASGQITGTFAFGPTRGNPNVASGSYRVAGSIGADGKFRLKGVQWIQQPAGYGMVGLHGKGYLNPKTAGGPPVLFGDIIGSGCTQFALEKQ
ncbi:MAG TPA: hypothetical protein VEA44_06205 [Caulobacter sp.]|nr:hypothetical protein [Caulobacter sp.]